MRYLDTAEKDCQEETRKTKVGKKEKKAMKENKGMRKMRKSKKELEALKGWLWKNVVQAKNGFSKDKTTQRWDRMKKKKKVVKKATEWLDNGKTQHLDDLIERRRMEGSSLKLDVMQKSP